VSLIPVLLEVRRVHRTGRGQVSAAAPVEAAAPGPAGER